MPTRSRSARNRPIRHRPARVHNGSGTIDKANVTNVIVSCTQAGRFAYVANELSNDISAYADRLRHRRLDAHRRLTVCVPARAPAALAVDPNGRFLYVVNNGSNDVSVYSIDYSTGALTVRRSAGRDRQRPRCRGRGSHRQLSLRGKPCLEQRVGLHHRQFHAAC